MEAEEMTLYLEVMHDERHPDCLPELEGHIERRCAACTGTTQE